MTPALRHLDIDVLRSLVAVCDLGGLVNAGRQRGRTAAALSLQMRKLERQAGAELFEKDGRRLVLNSAGEVVLSYARRILALNDEVQQSLHASRVSGLVRLGTSQDFGEQWLPPLLAEFRRRFPDVGIEMTIDRSSQLVPAAEAGELDLALTLGMHPRGNALCIGHLPLVWIAHRDFVWTPARPLPLAVFPTPCRFRSKATAELDRAGLPWEIALTSTSLYGIWAAVRAKLGVTLRTTQGLLPELAVVDGAFGLPNLGTVDVSLTIGESRSDALDSLVQLLRVALQTRIAELGGTVAGRTDARVAGASSPRLAVAA